MNNLDFIPLPLLIGLLFLMLTMCCFRRRGWAYLFGLMLFGFYLLAVIAVVFFPIPLPEGWPANLSWEETLRNLRRVNLTPFYYGPRAVIDQRNILRDIVANFLLTIPFGIGACFLSFLRGKRLILGAAGVGLALEGFQLLLKLLLGAYAHSVDINDVLLNALGVLAGCGIYRGVKGIVSSAGGRG